MRGFFIIFISRLLIEVDLCPSYKNGDTLELDALVGTWLTVYTQPKSMECFSLHIRATTELERDQCTMKFGNFNNSVDWNQCLLEVLSPLGKHFLQGNGTDCGVLENIIIVDSGKERYELHRQPPNQWLVFGRRGDEVLVMRDAAGGAAAAFARAPFWPTTTHLHALLHRGGVARARDHALCRPDQFHHYYNTEPDDKYAHF